MRIKGSKPLKTIKPQGTLNRVKNQEPRPVYVCEERMFQLMDCDNLQYIYIFIYKYIY